MKDVIRRYQESLAELRKVFDCGFYSSPEVRDEYWFYNGCDVVFHTSPITEEVLNSGSNCSEEAKIISEKPEYILFFINSCTGDNYYAIFDNYKRQREFE